MIVQYVVQLDLFTRNAQNHRDVIPIAIEESAIIGLLQPTCRIYMKIRPFQATSL